MTPTGTGLHIADTLTLPIDAVTETDLHWAAGLFEGEGTVTIAVRNSDETYRLVVTMGNTDAEVVDFFCDRWPGWRQPAYGDRPGRKPAWYWTVAGPKAEAFVHQVMPYLRTQRVRDKCEIALRFRASQPRRITSVPLRAGVKAAQRDLYLEMRKLNKRGASVEEQTA